jgi:hypothetical protein
MTKFAFFKNIIRLILLKKTRRKENVAHVEKMRKAYKFFSENLKGKTT